MKLAPIVPPGLEDLLPPETQRFFLFADLAITNEAYWQWFIENAAGKVVVDNQIYEGLKPLSPELFGELCSTLEPATIILPDSREGALPTLRMADQYMRWIPTSMHPVVTGVIQGHDFEELDMCASKLIDDYNVRMLAIPTRVPGRPSRRDIFDTLRLDSWGVGFHFLGADFPYFDEISLMRSIRGANILSMDTAEVTSAALCGHKLMQGPHPRVSGFMNVPREELKSCQELLWTNIRTLQNMLNSRTELEWAELNGYQ